MTEVTVIVRETRQPIGYRIKESGCWEWLNSQSSGYGMLSVHSQPYQAHRYVYERLVSPILPRHHLHHQCRNRICVNPQHLQMVNPSQHHGEHRKTHCKRGHPLDGALTGSRECPICWMRRAAERRAKDREKLRIAARRYYAVNRVAIRARERARYYALREAIT